MRRAEDRKALDLAAIEELTQDQASLDGLADADVIGDQQPRGFLAERHHQRGELVGARLEVDPAGTSERTGTAPQREPQGVAQEQRRLTWTRSLAAWRREGGVVDGLGFQLGDECFRLVLRTGQRAQPQVVPRRQDDPLATARTDQLAWREGCGDRHGPFPMAAARRASAALRASGVRGRTISSTPLAARRSTRS